MKQRAGCDPATRSRSDSGTVTMTVMKRRKDSIAINPS